MKKLSKIYIAGELGLVGSAIYSNLKEKGYSQIVTITTKELDLTDCRAVEAFFEAEKPEYVFLVGAKVEDSLFYTTRRAEILFENLMIQTNVIHYSYLNGVKKLMFLANSSIYPEVSPLPIKENYLLSGPLEYTIEPYAIAKIAGIKMCENYNLQYGTNFIAVMTPNLYGPKDNFCLETSQILPALIRKMYLGKSLEKNNWEAVRDDLNRRPLEGIDGSEDKKEILKTLRKYGIIYKDKPGSNRNEPEEVTVEIGGSGQPMWEFLWSEEMADACIFLMENREFSDIISVMYEDGHLNKEIRNTHINIGSGREISIAHLAEITKIMVGFKGTLLFNTNKPEGAPRRLSNVSKLSALGWKYEIELDEGIYRLYKWYKTSINHPIKGHFN